MGSGDYPLDGWENVDLRGADHDVNLIAFPWPFKARHYDELLASHVLEHFTRDDGVKFLQECHRILKKGGRLHIAVPDMDKFIDCRLIGDYGALAGYQWTSLDWMMGGDLSETVPEMRHSYMYCFASLAYTLERIGFVVERRDEMAYFDTARYQAISLYVDATKV